jgi:acetamidase/formamidase
MSRVHHLDDSEIHREWNNAIPPRLEIDPGDTVVFRTRDAADYYYKRSSTHADVLGRGPFRGHPLTGPVRVRGAEPGDTLVVEVVAMKPALDFGWTAIRPGRGLLPESDFPNPFLQIWDVSDGAFARTGRGIAVPLAPFPGVMGTALDEPGGHSTMPPRKNGGNMDIKQLAVGTTLYLPVWVEGALFSVGDGHGAQGDGEVCVTAVEMAAEVTLRFDLQKARGLEEPQFRTRGPIGESTNRGAWYATTAHGPDLFACAQQAVRYMIEHLERERELSREEAYVLSSVAVDLKISEIVDAPNWIVSAFLPESIFPSNGA